jgi:hypothetical protein
MGDAAAKRPGVQCSMNKESISEGNGIIAQHVCNRSAGSILWNGLPFLNESPVRPIPNRIADLAAYLKITSRRVKGPSPVATCICQFHAAARRASILDDNSRTLDEVDLVLSAVHQYRKTRGEKVVLPLLHFLNPALQRADLFAQGLKIHLGYLRGYRVLGFTHGLPHPQPNESNQSDEGDCPQSTQGQFGRPAFQSACD